MRSEVRAGLIALLLVVFAAGIGITVGTRARPAPTLLPIPSATTITLPSALPVDPAEVQRRAFAQPLSAGCATDKAVWLFADGGSAIRFDGRLWTIPDPTLRSLTAAACRAGTAIAVGAGGSLLTADDDRRELRADRTGIEDLHDVALGADMVFAVGSSGTFLRQTTLDWQRIDIGATEDLFGLALSGSRLARPGMTQVFAVGASGSSYRASDAGWDRVPTGTTAVLRTVVLADETAIAAGDRGVLLRYTDGRWQQVESGVSGSLRASALVGTAVWIVGDGGIVLELLGSSVRRVDLGTTCTLRAVFAEGSAVWIVGSDSVRGSAWRVRPTGTDRWGTC